MRKRNLFFTLVLGTLFIPSIESIKSASVINSSENENIPYESVDTLIATPGGHGSGGGGNKLGDLKIKHFKF